MGHNLEESKRNTMKSGKHDLDRLVGRAGWQGVLKGSFLEEKRPRGHDKAYEAQTTDKPAWSPTYSYTYMWERNIKELACQMQIHTMLTSCDWTYNRTTSLPLH